MNHSEAQEQTALFLWAAAIPELKAMYAIPNGGSRNAIEGKNLKAQGVKAGVPDICLPVSNGIYHALYIEMKVGKNKLSDKQKEYIKILNDNGNMAVVCYGFEEAQKVIIEYLNLKKYI